MKTIPFPVAHTRIANKKRSIVMAVCGWVVAMTFIVVDFATMKQPQKYTTIESVGSCVQFVQKMGSPIVVCYIKIYQTIRHHNTAAAPSSQGGHSSYGVEEAKITRMLTVVVVGFCLCWLPPLISDILQALDLLGQTAIKYWNFYFTFPFLPTMLSILWFMGQ